MMKCAIILITFLFVTNHSHGYTFTQSMWDENYSVYQEIIKMPFVQELRNGTLDENKFKNYIIQDYFYLQNYKTVYEILLSKSINNEISLFIIEVIKRVDDEIKGCHKKFFKKFRITMKDIRNTQVWANTKLYNDFLIKTVSVEPFEVGLVSTLPCSWIYSQIGYDIKKMKQVHGNKYQFWIDSYGKIPWKDSNTKKFVNLIENLAHYATKENRQKMKDIYKVGTRMEYMFFYGIYNNIK